MPDPGERRAEARVRHTRLRRDLRVLAFIMALVSLLVIVLSIGGFLDEAGCLAVDEASGECVQWVQVGDPLSLHASYYVAPVALFAASCFVLWRTSRHHRRRSRSKRGPAA
jgi:hypothetical protein